MSSMYARRFRMEIDLANIRPPKAVLPDGFRWIPWHPSTIARHAQVKTLVLGRDATEKRSS